MRLMSRLGNDDEDNAEERWDGKMIKIQILGTELYDQVIYENNVIALE